MLVDNFKTSEKLVHNIFVNTVEFVINNPPPIDFFWLFTTGGGFKALLGKSRKISKLRSLLGLSLALGTANYYSYSLSDLPK